MPVEKWYPVGVELPHAVRDGYGKPSTIGTSAVLKLLSKSCFESFQEYCDLPLGLSECIPSRSSLAWPGLVVGFEFFEIIEASHDECAKIAVNDQVYLPAG